MSNEQFEHAENDLIEQLKAMREANNGASTLIPKVTNGDEDSVDAMDDVYDQPQSSEQQAAWKEYNDYCRLFKNHKKYPKKLKKEGRLMIGGIQIGVVEERGEDIDANPPFVKCNLSDFIDNTGYFNLVKFLSLNKQSFPYLYKLACCLSSLRTSEVGCERFFSVAGYVSNPRRTRLKVRHYEATAMLKQNLHHIYLDEEWVVREYMALEKSKAWDVSESRRNEQVVSLEKTIHTADTGFRSDPFESAEKDFASDFEEEITKSSDTNATKTNATKSNDAKSSIAKSSDTKSNDAKSNTAKSGTAKDSNTTNSNTAKSKQTIEIDDSSDDSSYSSN